MAGKQVITILPDGRMQGLDHKRKGLDLRQFGKAKTERVTLIEWEETRQRWFIVWTDRVYFPPQNWTRQTFADAGVSTDPWPVQFDSLAMDETVFFVDYEDAVAAEVAVIQAMQLKGDTVGVFAD